MFDVALKFLKKMIGVASIAIIFSFFCILPGALMFIFANRELGSSVILISMAIGAVALAETMSDV